MQADGGQRFLGLVERGQALHSNRITSTRHVQSPAQRMTAAARPRPEQTRISPRSTTSPSSKQLPRPRVHSARGATSGAVAMRIYEQERDDRMYVERLFMVREEHHARQRMLLDAAHRRTEMGAAFSFEQRVIVTTAAHADELWELQQKMAHRGSTDRPCAPAGRSPVRSAWESEKQDLVKRMSRLESAVSGMRTPGAPVAIVAPVAPVSPFTAAAPSAQTAPAAVDAPIIGAHGVAAVGQAARPGSSRATTAGNSVNTAPAETSTLHVNSQSFPMRQSSAEQHVASTAPVTTKKVDDIVARTNAAMERAARLLNS
jgi:hypothetical protein